MEVTIRPNLNTGPRYNTPSESTIHDGRLGAKLDSREVITIYCTSTVVRASGQSLAQTGKKTVHAGLIGDLKDEVIMPCMVNPIRVSYNPHKGDTCFHIEGVPFTGGELVTIVGHRAYLANGDAI